MKIFACIGSGGVGFNFCCKYMVKPMRIGQAPIIKKVGGSQGINPNKLNMEVGSAADKSLIQPKNGWCLISSEINSILYMAKKKGIWINTGKLDIAIFFNPHNIPGVTKTHFIPDHISFV